MNIPSERIKTGDLNYSEFEYMMDKIERDGIQTDDDKIFANSCLMFLEKISVMYKLSFPDIKSILVAALGRTD
jgi:hypothetical protein